MAKIVFTTEEKLNILYLSLCDGMGGYSAISVAIPDKEYKAIRDDVKPFNEGDSFVCREDVWMFYLLTKQRLPFYDSEEGRTIWKNFDEIMDAIDSLPIHIALAFVDGCYDADDADAVLQIVALNEIIYG